MRCRLVVFFSVGVVLQGCLGNVVAPLVAPQTVVAGTASSLVNRGMSAMDGAAQAAQTVADLDHILAANPDPVNRDELLIGTSFWPCAKPWVSVQFPIPRTMPTEFLLRRMNSTVA
jgi:hypothetical protein